LQVQAQTFAEISAGWDVLAQAKTGTGKTLGFLIPSIEVAFPLSMVNLLYPTNVCIIFHFVYLSLKADIDRNSELSYHPTLLFLSKYFYLETGPFRSPSISRPTTDFDPRHFSHTGAGRSDCQGACIP
jgi:hypothetical protein